MPRHGRKMRGGFGEDLWNSMTNAYESAKNKVMGPSTSTYTAPVVGGKRRRTKRMMGGFTDNTPTTGLASTASPISGVESPKPMWVGGKTRKRRGNRNGKSRRNRKSSRR
ncbi:MAG: hypothetical protein MUP82_05530 [Candidatus Marinimicrobia bacterium]|nr:hypothetical protein [Candidatus Neomarinimicrobiota bacterium]